MRKLSSDKRASILSALVEGNSINATARLCGCSKITVLRLLADAGTFCAEWHDERVRGVEAEHIQCDEIWAFCHAKATTKARSDHLQDRDDVGDVWTWTGMDSDTKLMLSWLVGNRDIGAGTEFMRDLRGRVVGRPQISTDGHLAYRKAVLNGFGSDVDHGMLVKIYGGSNVNPEGKVRNRSTYGGERVIGTQKVAAFGRPDLDILSTSFVERQNLTMRMSMRRFTRKTNAHSKKFANHCHALALHYFYYNWCRKHQTLKTTPAVAAGLASKAMTIADLVELIEAEESRIGGRLTDYLPAGSK